MRDTSPNKPSGPAETTGELSMPATVAVLELRRSLNKLLVECVVNKAKCELTYRLFAPPLKGVDAPCLGSVTAKYIYTPANQDLTISLKELPPANTATNHLMGRFLTSITNPKHREELIETFRKAGYPRPRVISFGGFAIKADPIVTKI